MTDQRRDGKGTEFGLWLRGQLPDQQTDVTKIDSKLGFLATNIDYLWRNWKNNQFMFIEEKRYEHYPKVWQIRSFEVVNRQCVQPGTRDYCGFHILIFENTNPDDGQIWLDGRFITSQDLLDFLAFEKEVSWYLTYLQRMGNNHKIAFPEKQNILSIPQPSMF